MKKTFLIFTTCLLLSSGIQSQVTIGSGQKPVAGALLDLKDGGTYSSGETAVKGLGLPRVELKDLNKLKMSDGPDLTAQAIEHTGLIVYNVNNDVCSPAPTGLYVWDGNKWQGLGTSGENMSASVYTVTDSRDGEVYLARNFGSTAGDWMLENLRYLPNAADGFTHSAADSTDKYYIYPDGDENPYVPANHPSAEWAQKKKNGLLYNWFAATNGENLSVDNQFQGEPTESPSIPIQGICPPNWHLPNDRELSNLEREIYNNAHLYSTYTETEKNSWAPWQLSWEETIGMVATEWRPSHTVSDSHGAAMKSPCPTVGNTLVTNGKSLTAKQGGFDILLVGYGVHGQTVANEMYGHSYMWSSSSFDTLNAGYRSMVAASAGGARGPIGRGFFLSVRCKKN